MQKFVRNPCADFVYFDVDTGRRKCYTANTGGLIPKSNINNGVDGEKYRGRSVSVSRRQWKARTRVRAKNTPELQSERG